MSDNTAVRAAKLDKIFGTPVCAVLLAIFCNVLWGSAFPFIKLGYRLFSIDSGNTASIFCFAGVRFMLGSVLVLLGSWWGVRRRDRAAEQEAEAEHLLAGAGAPDALPRRWVTLFWSQRSSIAESRWADMVESSLIIGSDAAQCDLCLPDRKVSPQHCVLAAQGDALLVQPLSDRAKVYVNGERIDGEHRLQNNDTLRIGKTTVRLVL